MATQTIEFDAFSLTDIGSGTITATLDDGSDTALAAITEVSRGTYTGTVTDHATGDFKLIIFYNGKRVASWWVNLAVATATYQAVERWELVSQKTARVTGFEAGQTPIRQGVEYRYTASDDGEFYDVTISETP